MGVKVICDSATELLFMQHVMNAGILNVDIRRFNEMVDELGIPRRCNVTYEHSENFINDIKNKEEKKMNVNDYVSEGTLKQMDGVVITREEFTQEHTLVRGPKENEEGHTYTVENVEDRRPLTAVSFQRGPIKEYGVNGIHNEDLLLILIDRLERFQNTEYACDENDEAIKHLYLAVKALRERTNKRRERGVLGTSQV